MSERNYFLLRMFNHEHQTTKKLFKKDYVGIGFSTFSKNFDKLKEVKNNLQDLDKTLKKIGEKFKWFSGYARGDLRRFLLIKKGDWLIIPNWKSFHLVEVVEDFKNLLDINILNNKDEKLPDIGFVYKIKKIGENISRSDYANNSLTSRMKARQTCLHIDDLKESIETAINAHKEKKPLNFLNNASENLKGKLQNLISGTQSCLTPDKFESLVIKIMQKLGASNVEKVPISKDKGDNADADIKADFENIHHTIYIQAKHHNDKSFTNSWAVDQINNFKINTKDKTEPYQSYSYVEPNQSYSYWVVSSAKKFTDLLFQKYFQITQLLFLVELM